MRVTETQGCTVYHRELYSVFVISYKGFPRSSDGKESVCNAGDAVSIPGLGKYLAGGLNGQSLAG